MDDKIIKELNTEALPEHLDAVTAFVEEILEQADCPAKTMMQIEVAVEEIFVNVASYAYAPETGFVSIREEILKGSDLFIITFTDSGVPYDPLKKEDPDVTLSSQDRQIGGLGIFMTKKLMDEVTYEYKDGKNILKLVKKLRDV